MRAQFLAPTISPSKRPRRAMGLSLPPFPVTVLRSREPEPPSTQVWPGVPTLVCAPPLESPGRCWGPRGTVRKSRDETGGDSSLV